MGGPLKKYKVTSPTGVETVMKLNAADAEARGLSEGDLVHAAVGEPGPQEKAEAPVQNKARTASANKGRGVRGGD